MVRSRSCSSAVVRWRCHAVRHAPRLRLTSCGACSPSSSARPGHASSSHLGGGSNATCPSSSCCGSCLDLSANHTCPASTHPRPFLLPLVRLESGHPAWSTSPTAGRAHGRWHRAIRAHAGQYVGPHGSATDHRFRDSIRGCSAGCCARVRRPGKGADARHRPALLMSAVDVGSHVSSDKRTR